MSDLGKDSNDNHFRPPNKGRTFVSKEWGWEDWIVNKEEYCGKILFIKKGMRTSWHFHEIKDEVLYINQGRVDLAYGIEDEYREHRKQELAPGDSFHVARELRHQIVALEDSYIFEFSTQHFDSDSHRLPVVPL